jgi:hypothetical protein
MTTMTKLNFDTLTMIQATAKRHPSPGDTKS